MDKYEIDEILNMAIMTKTPHVIVEGVDDVGIYERICNHKKIKCEIYPSAMIQGLQSGNIGVIKAIEALEEIPANEPFYKFVIGIIDRDTREFRGDLPNKEGVFVLNHYSIENHFATKENAEAIIKKITRAHLNEPLDHSSFIPDLYIGMNELYYFTLEALKCACDASYVGSVKFSDNPGKRKDTSVKQDLLRKKEFLDVFAEAHGISNTPDVIRHITKGKWLLVAFSESLYQSIQVMPQKCKGGAILQCRSCSMNSSLPCFYSIKDGYNHKTIYALALDFIENNNELSYISNKFEQMAEEI